MTQLTDLIQQGRSAGKADDAIWKELSSQGWADADISRALGESAPVVSAESSSLSGPVATSGVSAFIGGLLLVLVLGGFGAYVVSWRMQEPEQESVSEGVPTASVASAQSAREFRCRDMITDSVFMGSVGVGISSYELDERMESYGDEQSYYCDYTLKNPPQGGEYAEAVSLVVNAYPSGYSSIEDVFALLSQKSPESFMLSSNKQYIVSFLVVTNSPALRSSIIAQLKQSADAYLSR